MGIFDIFFRKKAKTFEKSSLENLEEATKKKISEYDENFKQQAENFLSRVKEQKQKLKDSLNRLSSLEVKEQVDPQLLQIAMTSRKSFVKKLGTLAEQEEQKNFSISSVSLLCKTWQYQMDEVNASTVSEFASIKEVFKGESFAVIDEMKNLKKIYDNFSKEVKKKMDEINPYEEIQDKIKIVREEKERLENFGKDLENIVQKSDNLKKENEMLRTNLQKLEEGDDWKGFLEMKRKRSEKENEKTELISKVVQNFSAVERPLKKLNKLLQTTKSDIDAKMLEKYLSSPFDAFIEDYERKTIGAVLKEAAKYVEENKIDEKKSLEKLKEMIANDTFNNLAKEWQRINSELTELSEKIENNEVDKKRNEMLKTIFDREREMKESEKETIEEQMKTLEEDFAGHKEELQQLARENMSMEIEL